VEGQDQDRWKGKIKIGPDFFEPLPPEELEGWE